MTSSRFAGKHTIKLPAVCHKELYDLPDVYAARLPSQLSALAVWRDTTTPIVLAETLDLFSTSPGPGWAGYSAQVGYNLAVQVVALPTEDTYDITMRLRIGPSVLDAYTWLAVVITPPRPFASELLFQITTWPTDYRSIQLAN